MFRRAPGKRIPPPREPGSELIAISAGPVGHAMKVSFSFKYISHLRQPKAVHVLALNPSALAPVKILLAKNTILNSYLNTDLSKPFPALP